MPIQRFKDLFKATAGGFLHQDHFTRSFVALVAYSFIKTGRIDEGGNLQGSYHGWAFDGAVKCLENQQAEKEGP